MNPPPSQEAEFDADQCLQGLQGQAAQGRSARAGALMRELLEQQMQAAQADALVQDEALMARLQAAGAFRHAAPGPRLWSWLREFWRPAAMLPLGAALCGLLWLQLAPRDEGNVDEANVLRGAESALQLRAAEPQRRAAELQALLQRHGVASRLLALPSGQMQLQALVPPADGGAATGLRQALAAEGVDVPAHGRLNLLIRHDQGKPQDPRP